MEHIQNHRVRRLQAKRDVKTKTCSKHPGSKLILKGTQTICPQCYRELLLARATLKLKKLQEAVKEGTDEE